jgi:aspartate kinase
VVSAFAGMTDLLLEHKKSGAPGVYGPVSPANDAEHDWREALGTRARRGTLERNADDVRAGEDSRAECRCRFVDRKGSRQCASLP